MTQAYAPVRRHHAFEAEIRADAFPAGLSGEIDAATVTHSIPTVHLARLLRWDAYRDLIGPDCELDAATSGAAQLDKVAPS